MEGRIEEVKKQMTKVPTKTEATEAVVDALLFRIQRTQGNHLWVDPRETTPEAIQAIGKHFDVETIKDGDRVKQYRISW